MKLILGTLAAAVVAGGLFVQPAQAACWSNGYYTQCSHHGWWRHHHRHHYWHRNW
ncbi:MAG TPA: hypothetical protein VFW46_16620 [Stellaceae bacterium]|jgi:hypothetical protein|nr:hypothetical protein [Stellaceae bacterium]